VVHLDLWNLHRDPEQYPEPLRFLPERFYDKEAARGRHPNAWQGFGDGARKCLGYRLATMEIIQVGLGGAGSGEGSRERAAAAGCAVDGHWCLGEPPCPPPLQRPTAHIPPQIVATLYQKFTFELDAARTRLGADGYPQMVGGLFLQYKDGVWFQVHERPPYVPAAAEPAGAPVAPAAAIVA
jgi:hypothetical protein